MARTQAADYAQRREAIVDAAARLFARRGFSESSVSELAKASGISKSLLYHYFPSKEDILFAVMASHIDQLEDDVTAVTATVGSPTEKLGHLVHRFMNHYVGAADRQKVLLNELDALPTSKRAEIVGKQRDIIETTRGLVSLVYPAMAKDKVRSRAQTMLLFGMINWTHTWFDPNGPLSASDIATMVIDLALSPQAS